MRTVTKMAKAVEQKKKVWDTLEVAIPLEGASASFENGVLTVKGEKGEVSRTITYPRVYVKVEGDNVLLGTTHLSKREKKIIHTFRAHVRNMITGVKEGFTYKLAVVYAKFPLTVEMKGQTFNLKNLLGEKVPRSVEVPTDVKVDIKGSEIVVSGIDKERVGQVAANLEQLTRITHLDRRVIQDGIFITEKPHKSYV